MIVNVIGRKHVDYFSKKSNRQVTGDTLYFTYTERNTSGLCTGNIYVPGSWNILHPANLPAEAVLAFDMNGRLDMVTYQ